MSEVPAHFFVRLKEKVGREFGHRPSDSKSLKTHKDGTESQGFPNIFTLTSSNSWHLNDTDSQSMARTLLFTVLWASSVYASYLRFPQFPLAGLSSKHVCQEESKVVSPNAALPIVDLGYAKHRAVGNPNDKLYKFESIRYAAPPVGNLRFKAPEPPLRDDSGTVEDGSGRKECLQATVNWGAHFDDVGDCKDCLCCEESKADGSCDKPLVPCPDSGSSDSSKQAFGGFLPKWDLTDPKYYSEDCLFLDVWAPKANFDKPDPEGGLPVIVWIHGGAYAFGGKSLYSPDGILKRSLLDGGDGLLFVTLNYRMGALGFAAGKEIEDENVNAGILDQRRALDWVHEHIAKFGGDPESVTIVGLSAGGGSVLHHITAYGGKNEWVPFKRAVSLSGGWQPITNRSAADKTFETFMKLNGVETIDELRGVSEAQIRKTNFEQINNASPGVFLYNPTAWGQYTPESPPKLFQTGAFNLDPEVLVSHAFDEGGAFMKAFKDDKTTLSEFVDLTLPDLKEDEREWVVDMYNETDKAEYEKIGNVIADGTFRCHVTYMTDARQEYVYRQRWNTVKSNGHGGELRYLFYQPAVPVHSIRSALILQDYIWTFASYGTPLTTVADPTGVEAAPAVYKKTREDHSEQHLDSGKSDLPAVTRGGIDRQVESLCRAWQMLSTT